MRRSPWFVWSALVIACARSEPLPDPSRDPDTSEAPRGGPSAPHEPSASHEPAPREPSAPPCAAGDWCWAHGQTMYDLAAGGGEVFAVGALGGIASWDGERFAPHASPTQDALRAVWLSGPDDVWVTSSAYEVFRYDGAKWTQFAAMGSKLSGSAPDDVWLDLQHFDGTGFRERRPPGLGWFIDLLARGRDDVWVVGLPGVEGQSIETDAGIVMHWDGRQWRQRGERLSAPIWNAELATADGEIWIDTGVSAFRLEGESWREQVGKFGFHAWQTVQTGEIPGEVIALFDGDGVARVPASTRCMQAARVSAGESFCFSGEGRLFRFDGENWNPAPLDPFGATLPADQWGKVSPELWAGDATVAWGSGPTNVFRVRPVGTDPAAPLDALERYDGRQWSELARGHFYDVSGSAADDVWIAGKPLLHWDGRGVSEIERPAERSGGVLNAVMSFGPRAAYFIASNTEVLRYDGAWSVVLTHSVSSPAVTSFDDLAGDRAGELWVIATRQPRLRERGTGMLIRVDGSASQAVPLWETWGLGDIELDRENLWISDGEGVYRLPRATALDSQLPAAVENTFGSLGRESTLMPTLARLWRGPSDLWLTTSTQAMRLPL